MREMIKNAIAAHGAWKNKFRDFMEGKSDLDAAKVRLTNACELGKWLESGAKHELDGASVAELSALHSKFHEAAAAVVAKKKSGDQRGAEASLGAAGEFATASSALVRKLMELEKVPVA